MTIAIPPPPEPADQKVLIRVTKSMLRNLTGVAENYHISRNELIRQLLTYGLDQLAAHEITIQETEEDTTNDTTDSGN